MSDESPGNLSPYLQACEVVNHHHDSIIAKARDLVDSNLLATVENCFLFVRDEVSHSGDFKMNPVTCKASDVLKHRTGYCYAKSHLLCALLRSNKIPAGLCYQRLSIDGQGPPFCVHGLNAVWLPDLGWYRIDPRGNRTGIDAQFSPPQEQVAFPICLPGEHDLKGVHAKPLSEVLQALRQHETWDSLGKHLPDVNA